MRPSSFTGEPKCTAYYDDFWIFGEGSGDGTSDPKDDQLIVDQGSDQAEQGSGSGEGSGDGGKTIDFNVYQKK